MEKIISIISEKNIINLNQEELNKQKNTSELYFEKDGIKIYKNSFYKKDNVLYFIAKHDCKKALYLASKKPIKSEFKGEVKTVNGLYVLEAPFNYENSVVLKKIFPFTAPVSLRNKTTTIGCGDRLGLATPGHIRAARKYDVYPVLAQQSIRELTFTKRTFNDVISNTAFMVFQEGFEKGYGADGDHLKTFEDIDTALKSGMPMITLDLSEVMNAKASDWNEDQISKEFDAIDQKEKKRILDSYANKDFKLPSKTIHITEAETKKCTVMYKKACDFAKEVDALLKESRGDKYDLEISIDETTTPTLPEHHLFIIKELNHRKVTVNSLAPRFIGEFQKAIDYIGDIEVFEEQFAVHCDISKANGNYKISIHSGSDKFSVYPVIGAYTKLRFHLKTAGTSWLEAVRCISKFEPAFYRKLHKKAFEHFANASKFYHITGDISKDP